MTEQQEKVQHHIDIEKKILQEKVQHHIDIEKKIIEDILSSSMQKEVDESVKMMDELEEEQRELMEEHKKAIEENPTEEEHEKMIYEWKEKIVKDMNLDYEAEALSIKGYNEFERTVKKSKFYENIKLAKKLVLYEYYDGLETKIDDGELITIKVTDIFTFIAYENNNDENGIFLLLFMHFIAFELHTFENLESLSYTTRFGSDTSYSSFLYKPNKLEEVTFEHMEGLSIKFIRGLRSFNQQRYDAQEYE